MNTRPLLNKNLQKTTKMDASNYNNRHEVLGVGNNAPTTAQVHNNPATAERSTVNQPATTTTQDFAYNPGQATHPTEQHDLARREAVSAVACNIPSPEYTRQQLAAAQNSELTSPASKTAVTGVPPTEMRRHRESNYAAGYESAAAAVPERLHGEEGHNPVILSHESLGGGQSGGSSR